MKKGSGFNFQEFLKQHGEKLAFGLFAVVVVACLYFAVTRETYTAEPEKLVEDVTTISKRIEGNDPKNSQEIASYQVRPFKVIGEEVRSEPYAPQTEIFPQGSAFGQHKRGEPEIKGVIDLTAIYAA